jgi:hypothetical protein
MKPLFSGFPKGLGNSYFLTTHVVDTIGASYLPKILFTQVTLTQEIAHTSPFAHGLGNIPSSLFTHMQTPGALLGHSIIQMATSQVIHTTTVSQATQAPYHTSHISTPYIGGQYSMGGKNFTGGKPTWLQHQQA